MTISAERRAAAVRPAVAAGPARPRLTIDLDALAENWRALDRRSGAAETAAVVKADAYGTGLAPAGRTLLAAGARTFFVAQAPEGAALREVIGAGHAIYAFNGFTLDEAEIFAAFDLRPVLNSLPQFAAFRAALPMMEARLGPRPRAALHIETGINRMALTAAELDVLRAAPPRDIHLDLVMSHLACADLPGDAMNGRQRSAFAGRTALARTAAPEARRSLSATGGTLLGEAFHFDLVRPGIGLYGGLPFADALPVAHLHAPLLQVREIARGDSVGYGATWTAARPSRIGIAPLGYADGIFRTLKGGRVFIDGRPAPVVGRVSMDTITIDLTDLPEPAPGAMAEILGRHQGVDDIAAAAGTIGYEVLTSLGHRYLREWTGGPAA